MKAKLLLITAFLSAHVFAQKEYTFGSTGQQKLLINPSFAGNLKGLNVQLLGAAIKGNKFSTPLISHYAGIDYGFKRAGLFLSNTNVNKNNSAYVSNQADLGVNYNIALNSKIHLIPSIQVSYIERRIDAKKLTYLDIFELDHNYDFSHYINYQSQLPTYIIRNASFSSGLLIDINKKLTFGAAFYDINQPNMGIVGINALRFSQVYHLSGVLFTEEKVQLQPYSVVKLQRNGNRYYEVGAYTSYRAFSLHTGFRNEISYNYKDFSTIQSQWVYFLLGAHVTYKKIKFGYTYKTIDGYPNAHELFFSCNLFNKDKSSQRSLMIN